MDSISGFGSGPRGEGNPLGAFLDGVSEKMDGQHLRLWNRTDGNRRSSLAQEQRVSGCKRGNGAGYRRRSIVQHARIGGQNRVLRGDDPASGGGGAENSRGADPYGLLDGSGG